MSLIVPSRRGFLLGFAAAIAGASISRSLSPIIRIGPEPIILPKKVAFSGESLWINGRFIVPIEPVLRNAERGWDLIRLIEKKIQIENAKRDMLIDIAPEWEKQFIIPLDWFDHDFRVIE